MQPVIEHSPVRARSLRVRLVDPTTDPRWAEFVTSHPDGLAFHHPAWLATLADTFGFAPFHLACEDERGTVHGVLPLVYRRGLLRGRQLWSLPYTPLAGPLARSRAALGALVHAAVDLAEQAAGQRLQLHSDLPDLTVRDVSFLRVDWYPNYVIDLSDRSEAPRFSKSRRRGIAKAVRAGVQVRDADRVSDVHAWYDLYVRTLRRLGHPPLPLTLFEAAWTHMRSQGLLRLLLAERVAGGRTELLAGAVVLHGTTTVTDQYTADRLDARQYHPSDMILGQAIYQAWEAGYRRYDLGSVDPDQTGLRQFKEVWGARPRPLYRYFYPPSDWGTRLSRPRSRTQGQAGLAAACWRRVPLAATRPLGRWIHQYL